MKRRSKRNRDELPGGYGFALDKVTHLQHQLVAATVKPKFEAMDVVRMLLPDETLKFVSQSRAMLDLGWSAPAEYSHTHTVPIDEHTSMSVAFRINCRELKLAVWMPEYAEFNPNARFAPELIAVLHQLETIHKQWEKVRTVVKWFSANRVSVSAVRYYWPSMAGFCGPGHPIHDLSGKETFKEPSVSVGPMLDLFRETAGIVGAAKFLPPDIKLKTTVHLGLAREGPPFGIL